MYQSLRLSGMTETISKIDLPPPFPDHTQLPESDGTFVKNFQEHPQCIILTDSIAPVLQRLHPDGQYCIGQDCGIYWQKTDSAAAAAAAAPDWFYVPYVSPLLDGQTRHFYVLWRDFIAPLIAIELASGNGDEERDATPLTPALVKAGGRPGKFWVYQQIIRIPYYAIYEIKNDKLEVYHLVDFTYHKLQPNERGHYPIPLLDVEIGLWRGTFLNNPEQLWLRWWDLEGNLLLTGQEEAALQRQRAEQAERKAAQLAERLRAMGIDPEAE
jgi:hypothetical protein